MTETENLVRDMAVAMAEREGWNWQEQMLEGADSARAWTRQHKEYWLDQATAALLVALPKIAEMAAGMAGKVILDARMGEIDNDLRAIGHILHSEIRGHLSKLETELRKGGSDANEG